MVTTPKLRQSTRRTKWKVRATRLLLVSSASLALGIAGLKCFTIDKARKVKALAAQLQTLVPGKSSRNDAEHVAQLFGGKVGLPDQPCNSNVCTFEMVVRWYDPTPLVGRHYSWDKAIWKMTELLDNRFLARLGIRMWDSKGWISVKGDTVSSVGMQVYVEGPNHQWIDARWTRYREFPEQLLGIYPDWPKRNYIVGWHHLHMGPETGHGLRAYVSSTTQAEYVRQAQNINFSCLTSLAGCSTLAALFPDAERDRQHQTE